MCALCLIIPIQAYSQVQTIYSWSADNGIISEYGGTIEQHNSKSVSRINYPSSGYHTINLVGKKESIDKEDNSLASVYFRITLNEGQAFQEGDIITITAMRNSDEGGRSNLYFLFDNGAYIKDTLQWANLGLMHEVIVNAGTEAKPCHQSNAKTEKIEEYSLEPSTNSFTIPADASGCSSFRITRNESQCMLYITSIQILRDDRATGICNHYAGVESNREYRFGPLLIKHGKKYINKISDK